MPLSSAVLNATADSSSNAKCPSGRTSSMERIEEQRAIERAWEAVKKFIAERDKYRCRMCGKSCRYGDPITTRADAHHIIFASAGGSDRSDNLLYVCRQHHDEIHTLRRWFLSGNADERDENGNGMVKVERALEGGYEVVGFI